MIKSEFFKTIETMVDFDGEYYIISEANLLNLVNLLGLREIQFVTSNTIADGRKFESPCFKSDDGAIFIKWHSPDADAPTDSLSHQFWTSQLRYTENRGGTAKFWFITVNQNNGEVRWSAKPNKNWAHIPLGTTSSDGTGKTVEHSSGTPPNETINTENKVTCKHRLEVTSMKPFNEIYADGVAYSLGESPHKYTLEEKELVLNSIREIMSHESLSEQDIFDLEQRYTILWLFGDNNDPVLEEFKKMNGIFDAIDEDFSED